MAENEGFLSACRGAGTWPGGVHLEYTRQDVTERLGELCDPRLNARQSLDLAFRLAELVRLA
jgi:3-deoxy-7-phosphoheptulonate synthase